MRTPRHLPGFLPVVLPGLLLISATAIAFEGLPDDSLSSSRLLSDDEAAEAVVETTGLALPTPRDDLNRLPETEELLPLQERLRLSETVRPPPRLRVTAVR